MAFFLYFIIAMFGVVYNGGHEMSLGRVLLFAVSEGCFGLGLLSEAIATA